jgi:hypothetical protein
MSLIAKVDHILRGHLLTHGTQDGEAADTRVKYTNGIILRDHGKTVWKLLFRRIHK